MVTEEDIAVMREQAENAHEVLRHAQKSFDQCAKAHDELVIQKWYEEFLLDEVAVKELAREMDEWLNHNEARSHLGIYARVGSIQIGMSDSWMMVAAILPSGLYDHRRRKPLSEEIETDGTIVRLRAEIAEGLGMELRREWISSLHMNPAACCFTDRVRPEDRPTGEFHA